jgi:FHS family L-fucose permease-like MFS transporter
VGGAIMPWFMGRIADAAGNTAASFAIPAICFAIVALYGAFGQQANRKASA